MVNTRKSVFEKTSCRNFTFKANDKLKKNDKHFE